MFVCNYHVGRKRLNFKTYLKWHVVDQAKQRSQEQKHVSHQLNRFKLTTYVYVYLGPTAWSSG